MFHLWHAIRQYLYYVLFLWFLLTFVISIGFIARTNTELEYYYDGAALLLASSILGFGLIGLHFAVHRRGNTSIVGSLLVETAVVGFLWILFLAGSAELTNNFPSGYRCYFNLCHLFRATQAFGWLTWITLTLLLANLIVAGIRSGTKSQNHLKTWKAPYSVHGENAANPNAPQGQTPAQTQAPVQHPIGAGVHPQQQGMAQV
ncbi:BQ2448_4631 [Microbotryum intermedium]|uniref:BQ2448_4631 protein n=1 Tax=Microbotryum intermedium TaxID=269621 RepID=A0A238FFC9_9BASI|nr:BQ2448_4631 [Microbotryum intermedium]